MTSNFSGGGQSDGIAVDDSWTYSGSSESNAILSAVGTYFVSLVPGEDQSRSSIAGATNSFSTFYLSGSGDSTYDDGSSRGTYTLSSQGEITDNFTIQNTNDLSRVSGSTIYDSSVSSTETSSGNFSSSSPGSDSFTSSFGKNQSRSSSNSYGSSEYAVSDSGAVLSAVDNYEIKGFSQNAIHTHGQDDQDGDSVAFTSATVTTSKLDANGTDYLSANSSNTPGQEAEVNLQGDGKSFLSTSLKSTNSVTAEDSTVTTAETYDEAISNLFSYQDDEVNGIYEVDNTSTSRTSTEASGDDWSSNSTAYIETNRNLFANFTEDESGREDLGTWTTELSGGTSNSISSSENNTDNGFVDSNGGTLNTSTSYQSTGTGAIDIKDQVAAPEKSQWNHKESSNYTSTGSSSRTYASGNTVVSSTGIGTEFGITNSIGTDTINGNRSNFSVNTNVISGGSNTNFSSVTSVDAGETTVAISVGSDSGFSTIASNTSGTRSDNGTNDSTEYNTSSVGTSTNTDFITVSGPSTNSLGTSFSSGVSTSNTSGTLTNGSDDPLANNNQWFSSLNAQEISNYSGRTTTGGVVTDFKENTFSTVTQLGSGSADTYGIGGYTMSNSNINSTSRWREEEQQSNTSGESTFNEMTLLNTFSSESSVDGVISSTLSGQSTTNSTATSNEEDKQWYYDGSLLVSRKESEDQFSKSDSTLTFGENPSITSNISNKWNINHQKYSNDSSDTNHPLILSETTNAKGSSSQNITSSDTQVSTKNLADQESKSTDRNIPYGSTVNEISSSSSSYSSTHTPGEYGAENGRFSASDSSQYKREIESPDNIQFHDPNPFLNQQGWFEVTERVEVPSEIRHYNEESGIYHDTEEGRMQSGEYTSGLSYGNGVEVYNIHVYKPTEWWEPDTYEEWNDTYDSYAYVETGSYSPESSSVTRNPSFTEKNRYDFEYTGGFFVDEDQVFSYIEYFILRAGDFTTGWRREEKEFDNPENQTESFSEESGGSETSVQSESTTVNRDVSPVKGGGVKDPGVLDTADYRQRRALDRLITSLQFEIHETQAGLLNTIERIESNLRSGTYRTSRGTRNIYPALRDRYERTLEVLEQQYAELSGLELQLDGSRPSFSEAEIRHTLWELQVATFEGGGLTSIPSPFEYLAAGGAAFLRGAGARAVLKDTIDEAVGLPVTSLKGSSKPLDESFDLVDDKLDDFARPQKVSGAADDLAPNSRVSPRQSEIDVNDLNPNHRPQVSFNNGREVPYGSLGSVRPDNFRLGEALEVKNYDLLSASNRASLYNTIHRQYLQRKSNLPKGTHQRIIIDIRGQNIPESILMRVRNNIQTITRTPDVSIDFLR